MGDEKRQSGQRAVVTESRSEKFVEVISGIQPGDTVLTGGLMQLRDGMAVSVNVAK